MNVWTGIENLSHIARGGTLTIGNFDGVHLGHRRLLQTVLMGPAPHMVMTFDPHPAQILRPERGFRSLFSRKDLEERLAQMKISDLIIVEFNSALAQIEAEDFLDLVNRQLAPSRLVLGYDFGLGRDRSGDLNQIQDWSKSHGVEVVVVEPVSDEQGPISSRRIRRNLEVGQLPAVRKMLGRNFYIMGSTVKGAGRGRLMGFPTINLKEEGTLVPARGVYVTRTQIQDRNYVSVTNIGVNPTFEDSQELKIETHVVGKQDFNIPVGTAIKVEFITRLRDEARFKSMEDLKKQIESDILKARECIKELNEAMDRDQPNRRR